MAADDRSAGPGVRHARAGRIGQPPYWDESVFYEFDMDEVLALEAQVGLLHSMCLQAVENVILTERYRDFGIPEWAWGAIEASWKRQDPHVYGRFDLRYDGRRPAKLLEYNADTPTSLLEAAVVQWYWLGHRTGQALVGRRPVEFAARGPRGAVGRGAQDPAHLGAALQLVQRRRRARIT